MFIHLLTIIILICAWDYWMKKRTNELMKNIKLVPSIPIFGSIFNVISFTPENLHLKFNEYCDRYGSTFRAWIFGSSIVVTADSNFVKKILNSQKHLSKRIPYFLLHPWLGNGLLLSNGEKWRNMRKIITPTFHSKILDQFVEIFDQQSSILVEKLRPLANEEVFDVYPIVCLATLDTIAETAMGVKINAQMNPNLEYVKALKDVTKIMSIRFMRPYLAFHKLFKMLAPYLYRKQTEGIATLHSFTENIIAKRRAALKKVTIENTVESDYSCFGTKQTMAFLDVLLQSTVDNQYLTDQEISEEVSTFMFAGHDTSTTALCFTLWLLSRHEDVQRKLYEEIKDYLGDDLHYQISHHDLQNMKYLNCVVKESLRLYPPIPSIGRYLTENIQIDDINVPSGTNVFIIIWEILRNPHVFPQPDLFMPERHTETNPLFDSCNYIPFSAGPRNCIGQRFALLEIKCFIAKIIRNFELLPMGEVVQPTITIVLNSKNGINLGMRPRC